MTDTKKKSVPQFRGLLFRVEEYSSGELGHYILTVEERMGKRPTHMLVSQKLDQSIIHMPEQYKDVIEVQAKQFVHSPNIIMIGVWS